MSYMTGTRRKRAEEALRESEERFRGVFENSTVGTGIVGIDGRLLRVNRTWCQTLGFSEQEMLAKTFTDITHPDDLEASQALARAMLADETSGATIEKRYLSNHGQVVWALLSASLVRDERGAPLYFISQIQDITERKRAEEALRESEERFRSVFENALVGTGIVGTDGHFLRVNRIWCETLGYSEQEMQARTFMDITHPDDLEASQALARAMLAGEINGATTEKRYLGKRGQVIWGSVSSSLVRDEQGAPLYFVSQMQDITERKQTEEWLRLLSAAVEEAPDGIQIVDLDGRIRYSNKAQKDIYGFSPEEYQGKHVDEVHVHPKFASKVIIPAIKKTGNWSGEILVKHKDGRTFPVWLAAAMVKDDKGEPIAMLGIIRDVTERKRAEEALRESEARLAGILDMAAEAIVSVDEAQRIIMFNKGAEQIFGYSAEEVLGQPDDILIPERFRALYRSCIAEFAGSDTTSRLMTEGGEISGLRKGGEEFLAEASISKLAMGGKNILTIVLRDITERRRAEEEIQHLAFHDPLTGVPNRRFLEERFKLAIAQARRSGQPLAVMSVDINDLKLVNDTFGHPAGDRLLCAVAERLTKIMREVDTVARTGGDEFLLLLPGANRADAMRIAGRIRDTLKAPVKWSGQQFPVTVSIGISVYPEDGNNMEALQRTADDAMYRAKEWYRRSHTDLILGGPTDQPPGWPSQPRKRAPARGPLPK